MASTISGDNGLVAPTGAVYNGIQSKTAVASTSGTSIDFTSIPSWVKRITVMFSGVSTSGTSNPIIQLGTGSTTWTTSGYLGSVSTNSGTAALMSTGFTINNSVAAATVEHGIVVLTLLTGNTWCEQGTIGMSDAASARYSAGSIALGATLTAVRITTAGGTDTFDAGSINIIYE